MNLVQAAASSVVVARVCQALGVSRASLYRRWSPKADPTPPAPRPTPERALTKKERDRVLEVARFRTPEISARTSSRGLTLEMVHYGHPVEVIGAGKQILLEAYVKHPERLVSRLPEPPVLQKEVCINQPTPTLSSAIEGPGSQIYRNHAGSVIVTRR